MGHLQPFNILSLERLLSSVQLIFGDPISCASG